MSLREIRDLETTNEFLQEYITLYNAKFFVVREKRGDVHIKHKKIHGKLDQIFSIKETRKICNDYTVRYKGKYYQLEQKQPTSAFKKDTVTIETRLDASIHIHLKGHYLNYFELPEKPKKEIDVPVLALTNQEPHWKPKNSHP